MEVSVKRIEIARRVSEECGLLVPHAQQVVDCVMDLMAEEILTGELSLPDFGRFEVRWTKPMIGRNPLIPDVEIPIPPRPKVYFKPSKELADRVIKTLAVGSSKK